MKGDRDEVMVMGTTPHLKWVADSLRPFVSRIIMGDTKVLQIDNSVSPDIPLDVCVFLQLAQP